MIKIILKSMLIGIANVIPGVSGGTAAVLLGMYDKLLNSISNFFNKNNRNRFKDFKYLFIVFIGVALGILLFSKIINFSLENFPKTMTAIFSLLILFSLTSVYKEINIKNKKSKIFLLLGIIVMSLFIYLNEIYNSNDIYEINTVFNFSYYIKLSICGFIAAGAMIIPGISGSLIMLILGEYNNVMSYISSFKVYPLFVLAIGVSLGIIFFSKIISMLLKKYRLETMSFIFSIIIMSLVQMWILIIK